MNPRQFEVNDDDEKSTRRERFHRRKATGKGEEGNRRPKGERYRRQHVNFDNMTDDDFDELLDEDD